MVLCILALLLGTSARASDQGPALVLAPTLFDSTADELRSYLEVASFIQSLTGKPVVVENYVRYEHIIDAFAAGKVDMTILGPLPYLTLKQRIPAATPLFRFREADGRDHYRCALVAFADDARALKTYAGARLALTQPFSTCGYVSAAWIFREHGVDIETMSYDFLGRHDRIALSVVAGSHNLGVVRDEVAERFRSLGVVTLAVTEPLPGFALVVNTARLDPALVSQIREGFLRLEPGASLLRNWPRTVRHGVSPVSDADYQNVSRALASVQIPAAGKPAGAAP